MALAKFYPEDDEEEEEEEKEKVDEKNAGKRRIRRRGNTALRRASADEAKGYRNINRCEFLQREAGEGDERADDTFHARLSLSHPIFFFLAVNARH